MPSPPLQGCARAEGQMRPNLSWIRAALGTSPDSVRRVAEAFLVGKGCPQGDALDFAAASARLACAGLGAVGDPARPGSSAVLQAAVAASTACEQQSLLDGEPLAASDRIALQHASLLAGLGLAAAAAQSGEHETALEALKAAANLAEPAHAQAWFDACVAYGFEHIRQGRLALAVATLRLAQEALGGALPCAEATRLEAWLLRQLAACHLAAGDPALAIPLAERAAESAGCDAACLAQSLRLALRARCALAASAPGGAAGADLERAALAVATCEGATPQDGLEVCCELMASGLPAPALVVLAALRQSLQEGAPPPWLSRLELAATANLTRVQVMRPGDSPQLCAGAASGCDTSELEAAKVAHVWNIACGAFDAGKPDVAAAWLRELPQGKTPPTAKWGLASALALCLWCGGEAAEARLEAKAALALDAADARASAVLLATEAGDLATCATVRVLPARAAHALARAAVAGSARPLEASACLLAVASAVRAGWPPEEDGDVGMEQAADILLLLAQAASDAATAPATGGGGAPPAAPARVPLGAGAEELWAAAVGALEALTARAQGCAARRVFESLWNAGRALAQVGSWELCARAFLGAAHARKRCGADAPDTAGGAPGGEGDRASANIHVQWQDAEAAQMCLVAHMAALLELARQSPAACAPEDAAASRERYARAAQAAPDAHEACQWASAMRLQQLGPEAGGTANKALPLVLLMEFEARAQAKFSGLSPFLSEAAAKGLLHPKCYLMMARLAMRSGCREASVQSIRLYLHATAKAAAASSVDHMDVFAMSLRELVGMYPSRNDSFYCFEEALSLLQGVRGVAQAFPSQEVLWLATVAWNNGACFGREGELQWAQKWIGVSLGFLDFCPALACHRATMLEAYNQCRRASTEAMPAQGET
ncbi:unnamed protein product [Prorocentrum cordatum]|uniref:Protein ZIP4 homolog n=1 Tax=Prorocentrum cordatum TaxID=2364126 RepID=A0ABN9T7T9_9DINO|nr:unnamed protein product [Polarella glacialis]